MSRLPPSRHPEPHPASPPSPGAAGSAAGSTPTRKRFLDWLLGTSVGGLALAPDDVPPNSGQIFKFGSKPGILVRTPAGELRAFSAQCTHLDCTVQFRDDLSHIWCACHNGHYDLNGRNIAGPPPRPLEEFDVNVLGEQIVVGRRA